MVYEKAFFFATLRFSTRIWEKPIYYKERKLRSLIADWNDFVPTHYPIVKETRIYLTKIYF